MKFGAFQNFKDKFLSRPKSRIDAYRLCAYGKLPIYKDYILWECHSGGAADFKRWLDESFGKSWEEFDGKGVTLRGPAQALLFLPGGKHAAALSIWPSTDMGGLRKFPFCLFAIIPRGDLIGLGVQGAIETVGPIWRSQAEEYAAIGKYESIEDLYSYLQSTDPVVGEPIRVEQDIALNPWLDGIDGTHGHGCRRRLEALARSTIAAYRSFPEQGNSLAVRVPLAGGAEAADVGSQAELWAEVFQTNIQKIPNFPSIIIELEENGAPPRAALLIWRDLTREDARLFGEQIDSYEFVENLVPVPPAPASADSAAEADGVSAPAEASAWVAALGA